MTTVPKSGAPVPTNAASSGVHIDKKDLKSLMKRNDRSGLIWLGGWSILLALSGYLVYLSFGSALFIPASIVYGGILTTSTYSLSHECAHGTAFRTRWLNELLFWISSFIYLEEHIFRRYTHARHHTYTYHKGLDAQMPYQTPLSFYGWLKEVSGIGQILFELDVFFRSSISKFSQIVIESTPESELPKLTRNARIYLLGYVLVGISIYFGYEFLLWYFVLPRILGAPVMQFYVLLQHIEMEEEQMDVRLSTRSFTTNRIGRFLYLNMNYHIEHHLYPTVPFHALPKLNDHIKGQLPEPDPGIIRTNFWALNTVVKRMLGKLPNENLGRSIPVN